MNLENGVALVTGGAVRIGRAIVETLSAKGSAVVIHYRQSRSEAEKLVRRLRADGRRAWALGGDLSRPAVCESLVAKASKLAGVPVNILVNNAAVFGKDSFETLNAGKLMSEFQTNLFAPLLLMKAFARRKTGGVIVNLLDRRITGLDSSAVPYVLTKKALAEATRLAALAFAPDIRVNAVAPGPVLPPPGAGENYLSDKAGFIPLQRTCPPTEVAAAVAFLLEQDALTGQTIFVDGGQHLLTDPQKHR